MSYYIPLGFCWVEVPAVLHWEAYYQCTRTNPVFDSEIVQTYSAVLEEHGWELYEDTSCFDDLTYQEWKKLLVPCPFKVRNFYDAREGFHIWCGMVDYDVFYCGMPIEKFQCLFRCMSHWDQKTQCIIFDVDSIPSHPSCGEDDCCKLAVKSEKQNVGKAIKDYLNSLQKVKNVVNNEKDSGA